MKKPILLELGGWISLYRDRASLTQEQLAQRAQVKVTMIRRLEQGRTAAPSLPKLKQIADALGVGLDDLFSSSGDYEDMSEDRYKLMSKIDYMLRRHGVGELRLVFGILREMFALQRLKRE